MIIKNKNLLKIVIVSLVIFFVVLAYLPSFLVPYYLDDSMSIVNNPLLQQPSWLKLWSQYGMRFIGYVTFWANIQLFGMNLFAFHAVNLAIHLCNGFLVYYFSSILAKKFYPESDYRHYFSILVALIWLVHPLNTQAVTYIVQRLASLVTLFYLLALVSYFQFRTHHKNWSWLLLFIVACILGILTKENFLTLFPLLFLSELIFSKKSISTNLIKMMGLLFLALVLSYPIIKPFLLMIDDFTRETTIYTRLEYLSTQLFVIGHYIIKYFYPMNLQFDMYFEVSKKLNYEHLLALVFHLALISSALKVRKTHPIITFGILLYYSAHMVESGIIPISDPAFEHRTYLPNIGLTMAFCALFINLNNKRNHRILLLMIPIILALMSLTFLRNIEWQDRDKMVMSELTNNPLSPRSHSLKASIEAKRGHWKRSELHYKLAIKSNLEQGKIMASDINNLMYVLIKQKKYQDIANIVRQSEKLPITNKDRSVILTTFSYALIQLGQCQQSLIHSKKALALDPSNEIVKKHILICSKKMEGSLDKGE